jgi:hypothetical protein
MANGAIGDKTNSANNLLALINIAPAATIETGLVFKCAHAFAREACNTELRMHQGPRQYPNGYIWFLPERVICKLSTQ